MGFTGGALAFIISYWINVFLVAVYVRFSHSCARSRAPLSLEELQDLKGFFKLAIPSAAMICLEWWSYEVLVTLSGLLPNLELQSATISICVSTESVIYTLAYGVGAAASIRVSNELGAGHPEAARAAVNASLVIVLSESLLVAGVLLLVRNVRGLVYSNEEEVVHTIAGLIPLLAISTTFNGLQGVLSGAARGAGWQRAGAFINLLSLYIAGLPTGCLLAFVAHLDGKVCVYLFTCIIRDGSFFHFLLYLLNHPFNNLILRDTYAYGDSPDIQMCFPSLLLDTPIWTGPHSLLTN